MNTLIRGQKVDLSMGTNVRNIEVKLNVNSSNGTNNLPNLMALMINHAGNVMDTNDFIYFNQSSNKSQSVKLSDEVQDKKITIDFSILPPNIEKIILFLTPQDVNSGNFSYFNQVDTTICNGMNKQPLFKFQLNKNEISNESIIIIGEVYHYNNTWKFNTVGRGYEGGLSHLFGKYNFNIASSQLVRQQKTPEPTPQPSRSSISLSKIELKKSGDKINLEKKNNTLGEVFINLNWNQQTSNQGFLNAMFGGNKGVDLDLGCLFELSDGHKGVIQALGNSFGSYTYDPFIELDHDDRSGQSKNGENLRINGSQLRQFKRILVFAFIYEGVANWTEVDGVVTLKQSGGPDVVVRLDNPRNGKNMCAIAMIENINNETMSVKKLSTYYSGHKELDRAYNWNMRWVAGSK